MHVVAYLKSTIYRQVSVCPACHGSPRRRSADGILLGGTAAPTARAAADPLTGPLGPAVPPAWQIHGEEKARSFQESPTNFDIPPGMQSAEIKFFPRMEPLHALIVIGSLSMPTLR